MQNYATLSKSYLANTERLTLIRRATLCDLLEKNQNLSQNEIVAELEKKGVMAGKSTVATDIAFFSATEKFMRGELSREEVEAETVPYRRKLYSAIYFLITDGIGPEAEDKNSGTNQADSVVAPESEVPIRDEIPAGTFFVEKKERAFPDYIPKELSSVLDRVRVLVLEYTAKVGELEATKNTLRSKIRTIEDLRRLLEERKGRTRMISGRFSAFVKKFQKEQLYEFAADLVKRADRLKEEKKELEEKLISLENDMSAQTELYDEQGRIQDDKIKKLENLLAALKKEVAEKELQLEKFRDYLEDDEDDCKNNKGGLKNGEIFEQYDFPKTCFNPPMAIAKPSRKFLKTFSRLSEHDRIIVLGALKKFSENGFAYNSLNGKPLEGTGYKEFNVNPKIRVLYRVEEQQIIFYKLRHKNAIKKGTLR